MQHKLLSATIIAPTAMEADAYATYCMVIGTEKAQEFILSRPDLEGCLIFGGMPDQVGQDGVTVGQDGASHVWVSPGFKLQ